ncbi:uncharacterized protein LOC144139446 isoform X2 [Haemaphysalis longicornis]
MRDECEKRVRECVFCNEDVEAWEKHKHEAECRQRPGSCQHCHKEFKTIAELEDVHYPQCCQIPVDCSFKSLGCGFVTRRKDMALHELGSLQHNAILVQEIDRLKEQNKTQLENKTNSALSNQTEFDRRIRALEDDFKRCRILEATTDKNRPAGFKMSRTTALLYFCLAFYICCLFFVLYLRCVYEQQKITCKLNTFLYR